MLPRRSNRSLHDRATTPWRRPIVATEPDRSAYVVPDEPEIVVAAQGTTTTIAVGGEWGLSAQPAIRQVIRSAFARSPECLVFDLGQLTFIDSSAVQVILELQKRCARQNVRLVIAPGSRAVQRPFEVLGLIHTLPFLTAAPWG